MLVGIQKFNGIVEAVGSNPIASTTSREIVPVRGLDNRAFLEKYARPGRIGPTPQDIAATPHPNTLYRLRAG